MTESRAPFSTPEYDRRLALVRRAMAAAGIDALFVTDPSNQAWLTGYDGWSFYVHQGVIVGPEGDPIWWGRHMDMLGARRTCFMGHENLLGYGDHFVQSTERHPMQDLAFALKERGLDRGRIGVEMENYYYSAKAHAVLSAALGAELVDATALVNWQRLVKSEPELAFIRKAARISEKVVQTAIERAAPGVRKNDLVAEILHAGITGVGDDWGDYPAIVPLTPSGLDATAAHLTWNGAPMAADEATFFELSGCYRRYHAPLCRTVYLGTPPDDMKRAEAAQIEGIAAGLEAARAGNRTCDIAWAFMEVITRHGLQREGRMGYPVGLSYPPDWGERTASIRLEDETVLEPGMVFHFMPALWMETWGLETTETILIKESGSAEALCDVPRQAVCEAVMLDQTKAILGELVAFPTVSSQSNLAMIDYLAERLERVGAEVWLDHDETGKKANLFATLGPHCDGGIVLSGHTDVVPVTDQDWQSDPFEMGERDGKLFGRGTCDMKGFIAACLAMAPRFAAQVGARPLHFAFTYDEETGCLGARQLAAALTRRQIKPRLALIGEPTSMGLVEGHKGCCEYTARFKGLEGHGSQPDRGVNAVEYAVRYVGKLLELREDLKSRAPALSRFDPPWTTINIGAVHGGSVHNVIAPKAQVDWEMRPVQGSDEVFVKDTMAAYCAEHLLPAMQKVHPQAEIVTDVIGEVAGLAPMAENVARDLLAGLTGANGADVVPFGTEAGIFQSLGMDVVVCGPGAIEQAHKADEYVTLSQLSLCLDMLGKLGDKLAQFEPD